MVDLHSNILEKLHCSKCNNYLSYAPIMITEDGENMCGRCVYQKSDKKRIRNKAYEDVATVTAFPCRYKESGCRVILLWEDVILHEDYCEYRIIKCPVTSAGTCDWNGCQGTLLDHYTEKHQELILEHPCSLDTDIVVDNDKNMLLTFLGFVFLVQIRCNTALSKLWHCVHCFAHPKIAQQFNFSVQFNNDENSVKKTKPVLAEKCLTMQIDKSIETNVNTLLDMLGDYKNIKCVLSILPKVDSDLKNLFLCSKCKNSELPAVFRKNAIFFCSKCKEEGSYYDKNMEYLHGKMLIGCKNNCAGCPYFNINAKLVNRHKIWECKWQQNCLFDCKLSFNELHNHLVNKTHNSVLSKWHEIGVWHCVQIKQNDNIFVYKFFMNKEYFKAYIYTQLPIKDIESYKFTIEFHIGGTLTLQCTTTPTDDHDVEIYNKFSNNNPHIHTNQMYYIRNITISQT